MAIIEEDSPEATSLTGTSGADTFKFSGKFGSETITDAGGSDTLWFETIDDPEGFSVTRNSFGVRIEHDSLPSSSVKIVASSYADGRFTINYGIFADTTWGVLYLGKSRGGRVTGSDEIDFMYGTAKKDRFYGGEDDDILYGKAGKDKLYGGEGYDTLVGGEGNDKLYGGDDDDVYIFRSGDGEDEIEDTDGDEELYFKDATSSEDFAFSYDENDLIITVGTGSNSNIVTIEDFEEDRYDFFYGEDDDLEGVVFGTSGDDDSLEAEDDGDAIYGGAGDDTLTGGVGDNLLDGGAGDDTLTGGAGDNMLYGGAGDDTLTGGVGDNMLDGGYGDDIYVLRDGGNDIIRDAEGMESLYFEGARGYGDFSITFEGNGDVSIAVGSDSVVTIENYAAGRYALFYGLSNNPLGRLTLGEENSETLTGSAEQDLLIGNGGNDELNGGAGNDYLEGGVGSDILVGGEGADTYMFSAGDSGTGTLDKDVIEDEGGKIVLHQGSGSDYQGATYTLNIDGTILTIEKDGVRLNVIEFLGATTSSFSFYTSDGTADTQLDPANFVREAPPTPAVFEDGSESSPFLATAVADSFTGSEGADWVSYANADSDGVVVDLDTGAVERTYAVGDTFSGIRNVIGSDYGDVLTGNAGENTLRGGDGNDILNGGGDNDVLEGGTGNDRLAGGVGSDTYIFNAGDGTDTVISNAGGSTVSTSAASSGNLVFTALTGDRVANSQRLSTVAVGNNLEISIDSDGDGAFGGTNDDKVILEGVFDEERTQSILTYHLYGDSPDPDNPESNLISRLVIGKTATSNSIRLDSGYGGNYFGDNILYGGSGNDRLFGSPGDEIIYGGDGNDVLGNYGSRWGNHLFDGGAGEDTYEISHFFWFTNHFIIRDQDNAGIVKFTSLGIRHYNYSDNSIDIFRRVNNDLEIAQGSYYSSDFKARTIIIENYYAEGASFEIYDSYAGGVRSAAISDSLKDAIVALTAVRDGDSALAISVIGTSPVLATIDSEDFIGYGGENTVSYANAGTFVVADLQMLSPNMGGFARGDTYTSIETLIGSRFGDFLLGDAHENRLIGGAGNDVLQGGAGNDVLDGGEGVGDVVSYHGETTGITLTLGEGSVTTTVARSGSSERDIITNVEGVFGSEVGDVITGNSANNILAGGGGSDEIRGGDGNDRIYGDGYANSEVYAHYAYDEDARANAGDRLYGEAGDDRIDGGYGNDFLDGGADDDHLIGGYGNDELYGGLGDDLLSGSAGNDEIYGGLGNDDIRGGDGNDILEGGDGNDFFLDSDLLGADTIDGGEGVDTISYIFIHSGGVKVSLLLQGQEQQGFESSDAALGFTGGGDAARGDIITDVENITGTHNSDWLMGDGNDNYLDGGYGNDRLEGGAGNDLLEGGGGDDSLYGGAGDDTLQGGSGNDKLYGGAGTDTYIFESYDYRGSEETIYDEAGDTMTLRFENHNGVSYRSGTFDSNDFTSNNFNRVGNNLEISFATDSDYRTDGPDKITIIDAYDSDPNTGIGNLAFTINIEYGSSRDGGSFTEVATDFWHSLTAT